jgi:hypothetical protein
MNLKNSMKYRTVHKLDFRKLKTVNVRPSEVLQKTINVLHTNINTFTVDVCSKTKNVLGRF